MDELQKASILLKHLAPKEREQILEGLEIEQREQLERMIADSSEVSHAELVGIVSEYQTWLQSLSVSSDENSDSADSVETPEGPIAEVDFRQPAISSDDAEVLAGRLVEEPATVLCAVLCQLHESTAREVFQSLAQDRKEAVVARLPTQGELKPIVKQELACVLTAPAAGREQENNPGNVLLARLVGS